MKKAMTLALFLVFGLTLQSQAASTNSNQGNKTGQASATTVDSNQSVQADSTTVQGNQAAGSVQTQEQNRVMNQGEETQIQTQEKNSVQAQDKVSDNAGKGKENSASEQRKSQVSNAVQSMTQLAERIGGIGQQVKAIAQNQNQNQVKLEQNIEKIQSRSGFSKFFFGPDYGEIKDAQKTLEQNKEQIRQINQLKTQLSNESDKQQLSEQIKVLEQANQEIEKTISNAQGGFSLFGWVAKILQ